MKFWRMMTRLRLLMVLLRSDSKPRLKLWLIFGMTLQKAELLRCDFNGTCALRSKRSARNCFIQIGIIRLLLRCASESGLPETHLARLRQWLTKNRVNQKKQDAIAMLRLMRRQLARGLKPKKISFCFQHTAMWESVWRQSGELRFDANAQPRAIVLESLLEELRLESDQYKRHAQRALERFFVTREAERLGISVSPERRKKTEIAFRRERKLLDDAELKCWMNDNNLEDHEFEALMTDEARVDWVRQLAQYISTSRLPEQLRLSGDYHRLLARAIAKDRALESIGLKNPCLENTALTENQLLHWYFEEFLGKPIPDDPAKYARQLGIHEPWCLPSRFDQGVFVSVGLNEQEKAIRQTGINDILSFTTATGPCARGDSQWCGVR